MKEVSVDVKVNLESGATLVFGCFQNWERKGYTVRLGSRGVELFKWSGKKPPVTPRYEGGKGGKGGDERGGRNNDDNELPVKPGGEGLPELPGKGLPGVKLPKIPDVKVPDPRPPVKDDRP